MAQFCLHIPHIVLRIRSYGERVSVNLDVSWLAVEQVVDHLSIAEIVRELLVVTANVITLGKLVRLKVYVAAAFSTNRQFREVPVQLSG